MKLTLLNRLKQRKDTINFETPKILNKSKILKADLSKNEKIVVQNLYSYCNITIFTVGQGNAFIILTTFDLVNKGILKVLF